MIEFPCSPKKVMSEKNEGLCHRGSRRWKEMLLLGNGKNEVIADKLLSYI